MKVLVDDQELFTITETQKKVIKNDINLNIFDSDMKRRLEFIVMNRYKQGLARLKSDWESVLRERLDYMPLDAEVFVELVKSQQDYKDKYDRDNTSEQIDEPTEEKL